MGPMAKPFENHSLSVYKLRSFQIAPTERLTDYNVRVSSSAMEEGVVCGGGRGQAQRRTTGAVRAQILLHQTGQHQTQTRLQTGDPAARMHPHIRERDGGPPQRLRRLSSRDLR